ncbi:DUF6731 family protein [Abiotrophia defectiva]|uniref:DUF6731 family protein n=1 Tax=Abiotrophia defectiva TaxID=46125 RepID=UPI0028E22B10|nr:DUF6731 family protein [Abiotrophia defectiva]
MTKVNVLCYRVFLRKGIIRVNYPIEHIFDHIIAKQAPDKLKRTIYGHITMNRMYDPKQEKVKGNRTFWLSKYRKDKPYTGKEGTDAADPIEDDVLEPCVIYYDYRTNVLFVQHKSVGPRKGSIQQYLNEFINRGQDGWNIVLEPISDENVMDIISDAEKIKDLTLEFSNEAGAIGDCFNKINNMGLIEQLGNALNPLQKANNQLMGNTLTMTFKRRYDKRGLNPENLIILLNNLNTDSENLLKAKVTIREKGEDKKIDLINLGIKKHKFEISEDVTDFNAIVNLFEPEYDKILSTCRINRHQDMYEEHNLNGLNEILS